MNQRSTLKYFVWCGGIALLLSTAAAAPARASYSGSPDRAVQIARKSRTRVERSGDEVKKSSRALFKEFADRTAALQELLDTRQQLEDSGLLDKKDPAGAARRAHINGKILMEVGKLKTACDTNLSDLLRSLDRFDEAVAESLVDSQATRSINTNYELALSRFMKDEKVRFQEASVQARKALEAYQDAENPKEKKRLLKRYNRIKRRLLQIEQRRRLYEARVKVAAMNQQFAELVREKIRAEGSDISSEFRDLLANLYNVFAKITPVAEVGGTGTPELMANLGFPNVEELRNTLAVVNDATDKLGGVLDGMVNDVMAGLGEIRVVNTSGINSDNLSVDEEMEFLRQARIHWQE
jgi:hypothetical protein